MAGERKQQRRGAHQHVAGTRRLRRGADAERGSKPQGPVTHVTIVGGEEEVVAGFDRERLTRSLGL